ncbi:hypothetical protein DM860_002408 [Cuscuta australis]|uniref:Peptidase A1 domain-containing protein n=1 Tax=Cuscuta australis TaxID=267555 RepID=A0A328D0E7_9ASTE|nr:hypothetical protein DM860_002408 [Cuscuta australis]
MAANGKGNGNGGFNFLIILLITILIIPMLNKAPIVVCIASNQGDENSAVMSLEVVHRLRLTDNRGLGQLAGLQSTRRSQPKYYSANLPVTHKSRNVLGSHSVQVWLGSTHTPLTLVLDTGSDVTWTQCQPCDRHRCYNQAGPIFDPKNSTTYSAVTDKARCGPGPCEYRVEYTDDSFSFGTVSTDNLTLSRGFVVSKFLFGCGRNNTLGGHDDAGVMGLGNTELSFVSQTSQRFGRKFSYCLNTEQGGGTGHLTFGGGARGGSIKYTELLHDYSGSGFYLVDMVGINLNGVQLPISSAVFGNGTFVDSGRSVSVLPLEAYRVLNDSFAKTMGRKYRRAEGDGVLESCYDLSVAAAAVIPKVSFRFGGGVVVDLNPASVVVDVAGDPRRSRACLAFVPDYSPDQMGVFGNYQQQTLEMVYDVAGGKLGFGQNGCT